MSSTSQARKVGHFGKAHPQFPKALKPLRQYLKNSGKSLPAPPASDTNYKEVASWPMDGNDQVGDCTIAAAAHSIQLWNAVTKTASPVPATLEIVREYFTLTGGPDSGLVESDVLKTWRSQGLWGSKIFGYAPVNVHDQTMLQQVISVYGLAYVGIQVPANAQEQFEQGKPWTLVSGWQAQTIEGGHAIPLVGYDAQYLYCVTWGAIQGIAYDWFQTYADEAWAILPQEFKQAGGFDGLDYATLFADLKQV